MTAITLLLFVSFCLPDYMFVSHCIHESLQNSLSVCSLTLRKYILKIRPSNKQHGTLKSAFVVQNRPTYITLTIGNLRIDPRCAERVETMKIPGYTLQSNTDMFTQPNGYDFCYEILLSVGLLPESRPYSDRTYIQPTTVDSSSRQWHLSNTLPQSPACQNFTRKKYRDRIDHLIKKIIRGGLLPAIAEGASQLPMMSDDGIFQAIVRTLPCIHRNLLHPFRDSTILVVETLIDQFFCQWLCRIGIAV